MLLIYSLLTNLDDARASSVACTHHLLEHRMRTNWKVVERLLSCAMENGWAEIGPEGGSYHITVRGRAFREVLEKAIAPVYADYLERRI